MFKNRKLFEDFISGVKERKITTKEVGSILERGKRYTQAETYSQLVEEYEKLPQISFDYEVLENSKDLLVVPFQGYWKDLGTWESMAEQMSTDTLGNVILGDNCRETQVINELNLPVVVNGTKNLVVVASKEGILVADKSYTENLKELVTEIKTKPLFEERRWGTLETLNETEDEGNITFTRKIRIFGGMNSSYHFHKERDEIWTVLKGKGELILEGSKLTLTPGKAVCIRKNQRHAIKALEDFEYIEIHIGTKVGNEDIHRLTFRWDEIETALIL